MAKMTKEIIKRDYKPFGGSFKSGQKLVTFEGKTYIKKDSPACLLYTSPSPRDRTRSRMPSSA